VPRPCNAKRADDGAIVWAGFFVFVVAYEEPALGEQFTDEYKRYRPNVRRWLPRITPWRG
jgi:protein-S-isoprenylcysteine O-methyltransferase Ste14